MFISSWFPWRLARQHNGRSRPPHSPGGAPRPVRLLLKTVNHKGTEGTKKKSAN